MDRLLKPPGGLTVEIKTPTKEERIAQHMRGIKMAVVPSILGIAAGLLSSPIVLSPENQSFSFLILAIAIYVQKFMFPAIGIKSSEFGFKDWFFLSFMTLAYWYLTWTLILNSPLPPVGPFF